MPTQTTESNVALDLWKSLTEHIGSWFESPDLESLEVTLSAVAAHYAFPKADPVWVMDVRVPGSGKTTITCEAVRLLPHAHLVGDLTPSTFISHFGQKDDKSLLRRVGNSGILVMKDFTTFLSKRPDHRAELVSQLREIYDGRLAKDTGTQDTSIWEGKITIIAGCTPAVERAWSVMRELGDRFVVVRSSRVGIDAATKASQQVGFEPEIARGIRERAKSLLNFPNSNGSNLMTTTAQSQINRWAEVTALMRASVLRGPSSDKILGVDDAEEPTRIAKALTTLALGHAKLFRHASITDDDLRIARRVANDCIPPKRLAILRSIPATETASEVDMRKLSGLHPTAFTRAFDELEAIGVIEKETDLAQFTFARFSQKFRDLFLS